MDRTRSVQRTFLKDIEVELSIGLHPWEKFVERPTRLLITVEMVSDALVSFAPDAQHGFIDYDKLRQYVRSLRERPHVSLLEELVHDIIGFCMAFEALTGCGVCVRKPDIFNDVDEAGVEVFVTRSDFERMRQAPYPAAQLPS